MGWGKGGVEGEGKGRCRRRGERGPEIGYLF